MRQIRKDSGNVSVDVYIVDSSDGTPETGVLFDAAGISLNYRRKGGAVVSIALATLAALTAAHADGGFLEIRNGVYRLDLPNAAVAGGAASVAIFGTVTGMIVLPQAIQIVDLGPRDVVADEDVSVDVYIVDSSDGTPETGVLFDAAGMDLAYRREGEAVVSIDEVALAMLTTEHTPGGFLEIGNGTYRLDLPDAAVATDADTVSVIGTVAGMIVLPQTLQLIDDAEPVIVDDGSEFSDAFLSDGGPALLEAFGQPVTYAPEGGDPVDIEAIFDENAVDKAYEDRGSQIERRGMLGFLRDATLGVVDPAIGDTVTINGEVWAVGSIGDLSDNWADVELVRDQRKEASGPDYRDHR